MHKGKTLFTASWLMSVFILVILNISLDSDEESLLGIADQREQFISFPYPVEIKHIFPVEGEKLSKGEAVLEVTRPDLASRQTMLSHEIDEISAKEVVTQSEINTKLALFRAQQTSELAKIDAEIQELESERRLNLKLLEHISGSNPVSEADEPGALDIKLRGLKEQRSLITRSLNSTTKGLAKQLEDSEKPNVARIAKLTVEKNELDRQQSNLKIHATFNSRVGSVMYKPGEQVPAFTNIISLHSLSPHFVKGFIQENAENTIAPGNIVWVRSQSNQNKRTIPGRIESLGSRIVEYPDRLKKSPHVQAWGREVVVSISNENSLLLGEMVVIDIHQKIPISEKVIASALKIGDKFNWAGHRSVTTETNFSVADRQ